MEKHTVATIQVRHGGEGTMVIVHDTSLSRKDVFETFMALSEVYSNDGIDRSKHHQTEGIRSGKKIEIDLS